MARRTCPHLFTWLIWTLSTGIVFVAQLYDGGAAGAWSTGVAAGFSLCVLVVAYLKGAERSIATADWYYLCAAFAALPLWYVSQDPLWAVALLTLVDLIAYGPTLRKSYTHPEQEKIWTYAVMTFRNAASIYALGHYSWTTMLFPALTGAANLVLIALLCVRRRALV